MKLKQLVNKAISTKPPQLDIYGDYYAPYYNLMYILAQQINNGLLVELGVNKGRGLISLAAANESNKVIGLDSHVWTGLHESLMNYPNAWFLNMSSMPVPVVISEHRRKIRLLHIDTEHTYSMAKAEFEAYKPYLAKGAYVLFDDLHAMDDDVMRYFYELDYEKVQDDRLHPSCGYGVLIYG